MAENFDPDPDIEAALRARSGGEVAVDDAFDAVLSRSGAIRRRRTATSALAVAVLAIGGIALLPRGAERDVVPADEVPGVDDPDSSTPSDDRDDGAATTTIAVVEDAQPVAPPTPADESVISAPTSDVDDTSDTEEDDPPSGSDTVPTLASTVTTATTSGGVAASPTTTSAAPSPTTTAAPSTTTATTPVTTTTASTSPSTTAPTAPSIAPFTKTYQSPGGSITVNWSGSALSLQAVTAGSGFVAEIEDDEPTRIRVRFRGEDDDARIQVRVVDGQLLEEIS